MPDIRDEVIEDDCREQYSRDWGLGYPWFKEYNQAMKLWLSHVKVHRPEEPMDVPVIYQTPERAFADKIRPRVNKRVDLPVISFIMTGTEMDRSRYHAPSQLIWDRIREGDRFKLMNRPMPWNISYNVTVWTKFQEDLDTIIYRLLSRFAPHSYIAPFNMASRVNFESHSDTSILEPGEDGDRIIRHDLNFMVNGYMPLPAIETGLIEQVNLVLTDVEDSDVSEENFDNSQDINIVEGEFEVTVLE
jgi:hypothetical protein